MSPTRRSLVALFHFWLAFVAWHAIPCFYSAAIQESLFEVSLGAMGVGLGLVLQLRKTTLLFSAGLCVVGVVASVQLAHVGFAWKGALDWDGIGEAIPGFVSGALALLTFAVSVSSWVSWKK